MVAIFHDVELSFFGNGSLFGISDSLGTGSCFIKYIGKGFLSNCVVDDASDSGESYPDNVPNLGTLTMNFFAIVVLIVVNGA